MARIGWIIGTAALCVVVLIASFIDLVDPDSFDQVINYRHGAQMEGGPIIGNKFQNIFWFVQITDTHISKFRDRQRGPDLMKFCEAYLSQIDPSFVIVSGDLVDAKQEDNLGSTQFEEEWQQYQAVVKACQKQSGAKWLDLRGNHDAFDVPDLESKQNYYRFYSVQGAAHPTSYHFTYYAPFGKYSFIGVDACPNPGPKRPFNFFGILNEAHILELSEFARESAKSNQTIWFGHYPSSTIVSEAPGLRDVMRNGVAYLCGHLHTLGGLVPRMYTRQKTGTLELELGDWKDNRIFRVLAFDHDILSFVDHTSGEWPVILITNPKHALFQSPSQEPLHRMLASTHVRILVFSRKPVKSVTVLIDNQLLGKASHVQGPLYTLQWKPARYRTGIHSIKVIVKDLKGRGDSIQQPFSLDGTLPSFPLVPRLLLMMNLSTLGFFLFASLVLAHTVLLLTLRRCDNIRRYYPSLHVHRCQGLLRYVDCWLLKLWLSAKTNFTFYLLQGYMMYITFGPWFMGDILEEATGCVFVWGMFVKGAFLPGSVTFFYGSFQLLTFNYPLLLLISHELDLLSRKASNMPRRLQLLRRAVELDVPFTLLVFYQGWLAVTDFPRAYGSKALFLGPIRTGAFLLALLLQFLVRRNIARIEASRSHHGSDILPPPPFDFAIQGDGPGNGLLGEAVEDVVQSRRGSADNLRALQERS